MLRQINKPKKFKPLIDSDMQEDFTSIFKSAQIFQYTLSTVELVLKEHHIGHTIVVSQDRWSLMTCSIILKCRTS